MNKFDFEQGLQQDREKAGVFGGPPPKFIPVSNQLPADQEAIEAKRKRDLIWEQKRRARAGGPPLPPQQEPPTGPPSGQQNSFKQQSLGGFQKATTVNAEIKPQEPVILDLMKPKAPTGFTPKKQMAPAQNQAPMMPPPVMGQPPPVMGKPPGMGMPPMGQQQFGGAMPPPPQQKGVWSQIGSQPQQFPPPQQQPQVQQFPPPQQFQQQEPQRFMPPPEPRFQAPPVEPRHQMPPPEPRFQQQPEPPRQQQYEPPRQQQYEPPRYEPPRQEPARQEPPRLQTPRQPQDHSGGQQVILEDIPGGGNLNLGPPAEKKNNKQEYLNLWQQEMKQKEQNKKKEKQERILREKQELEAIMNYNPFGKKEGPGAGPIPRQSPAQQQQPKQQVMQMHEAPQMGYQQNYQQQPMQNFQPPPPMQNLQQQPPPQIFQQTPQFQAPPPVQNFGQNFDPFLAGPPAPQFGGGMPPPAQRPHFDAPRYEPPPTFDAPRPSDNLQVPAPRPPRNDRKIQQDQDQPGGAVNGLGAYQYDVRKNQQEQQKVELQNALRQQMEEQRQRKEEELKRKKDEEEREELRLKKEREELEQRFKDEMESKKQKFEKIRQENDKLIKEKQKAIDIAIEQEAKQSFKLPINNSKQDLFGAGPQQQDLFGSGPQKDLFGPGPQRPTQDPFLSGPPLNNSGFIQPPPVSGNNSGFIKPAPVVASSPFKPTTSVMLQDQQALISDLKNNFQKEMGDLKQQMMAQQEMFQNQVDKLLKDQQDARKRKEEAEAEIKNVRKELENKLEQERQQQQVQQQMYQLAQRKQEDPMRLTDPMRNIGQGPSPHEILNSYASAENFRKPDIGKPSLGNTRGFSAKPPPHVLAEQNLKFPPMSGQKQRTISSNRPRPPEMPPAMNMNASRTSFKSRKSERQSNLGTYEKLFFNNSKGMERGVVSRDKNSQVVDLRGYGYTPQKEATSKFQEYMSTGKKSMIGHSDFLPVGEQSQMINLPPPTEQSGIKLASETSAYKPMAPQRGQSNYNYDFKMSSPDGERTNTMDFIDKMLNQDQKDNEEQYTKMFNGDEFKIPEYEGFQQNYIKAPKQEIVVGENFENYTQRLKEQDPSVGNRSLFGGNTLATLNLEALNQRQNDRLARIEQQQFDFESAITKSKQQPIKQDYQAPQNEDLKALDNLLFDILKN